MINLDTISKARVAREPFSFFAADKVLADCDLDAIRADFPKIEKPGIFPLSALEYGPAFGKLVDEIRSVEMADALGKKFAVNLKGLPVMITVRGHAQAKDGRIHTDTKDRRSIIIDFVAGALRPAALSSRNLSLFVTCDRRAGRSCDWLALFFCSVGIGEDGDCCWLCGIVERLDAGRADDGDGAGGFGHNFAGDAAEQVADASGLAGTDDDMIDAVVVDEV